MKPRRLHRTNSVRQGKIARLPNETRNLVNTMLNDGCSYSTIVRRLAELGHPGLSVHSISRWRKGGYEDWLEAQEKFDLEKLRAQSTADAIKDIKDPSVLQDASEMRAAFITFRALQAIDSLPEEQLLNDPSYFRVARIVNQQLAERTRRERVEARKQFTEAEFIDQLLADPEKLKRILTQIRARSLPPSGVSSPSPLSGEGRGEGGVSASAQ